MTMFYVGLVLIMGVLANRIGITIINLMPDDLVRWMWIAIGRHEMATALRNIPFLMFIVGAWNLLILTGYDSLRDRETLIP